MINSTPFFTVIIPTYNRAHLIGKTIDSLLNQTFSNFEVIIVDNKSTDNTIEILQPYLADARISLFVQDRNYERARSRNKGFAEATGSFVTLLDSDDILYPNCLQDAFGFHEENPALDFFHCGYNIIDEQGRIVVRGSLKKVKNPFKELSQGNYISNIGIFIKRDITNKVKVDETPVLIGMEDYDFILHVLNNAKKIGFLDKINCGILIHPQRTVLTQEMITIEKRVEYFVKKNINGELFQQEFSPYKKAFVSGNQLYLCGAAAIRKLPAKAFGFLLQAARSNPPDFFTIKYWKHFFVILKYMFR